MNVFVSYSHTDKEYLEAFLKFLRTLEAGGHITLWWDEKIQPGEQWDQEIRRRVDEADLAIFLVSQDFLGSSYIKNVEVEPLVRRALEGTATATCLFVRPSLTDEHKLAWENQAGQSVTLTTFQGLNDPRSTVADLEGAARERAYKEAAEKIKQLADTRKQASAGRASAGAGGRVARSEDRAEVTIRLTVKDGSLLHQFLGPYRALVPEVRSEWNRLKTELARRGHTREAALFQALFGAEESRAADLLQVLFPTAQRPNPPYRPVRVRIQTEDPLLSSLPWARARWEQRLLTEVGWSFELAAPATDERAPAYPTLSLGLPGPVLFLMPEPRNFEWLASLAHYQHLRDLFRASWPDYHGAFERARRWSQLDLELKNEPPVVYLYAAATKEGGEPVLLFEDAEQGVDRRPLKLVLARLAEAPIQLVFLNLIDLPLADVAQAPAGLVKRVPLVLLQASRKADLGTETDPRHPPSKWFSDVLQADSPWDPVQRFHFHAHPESCVWSAFSAWQPPRIPATVPREMAPLLLDRTRQRNEAAGLRSEVINDPRRFVAAMVGFGASAARPGLLGKQIALRLKTDSAPGSFVHVHLQLPFAFDRAKPEARFDEQSLRDELLRTFELGPAGTLERVFARKRPRSAPLGPCSFLFDYECHGENHSTPLRPREIEVWLRFCAGTLADECPPDARILALLTVETNKGPAIQSQVEELVRSGSIPLQRFKAMTLSELGSVEVQELYDYFQSGRSAFVEQKSPAGQRDRAHDAASWIVALTGGKFQGILERVNAGDRRAWSPDYLTELENEARKLEDGRRPLLVQRPETY